MKIVKPLLIAAAVAALSSAVPAAFAGGPDTVRPDATTSAFLAALNAQKGPGLETLSPAKARQVLVDAQNGVKVDLSGIDVSNRTIEQDGLSVPITIVRPQHATGTPPVFMFFHGGGWVLGDFPTHERLVRDLVVQSGAVAAFVNYTPSPEARYPVAINQAYAATKWVAAHGADIGVDSSRLAVVGNSVGGNMAAVVALMAKDKGGPAIRFQGLLWPVTDHDFDTGSYRAYQQGHFLTRPMMKWFWDAYTKNESQRNEIYASPLRASVAQLKGLPPALIQVAQFDVLRDEGEAYGRKLDAAGVEATTTRYDGTIHDFGLLNALATDAPTQAALKAMANEIATRLK
ncbi:alpha/beta hydrolase [Burkholderia multivorans]|uniref:alpha/beta hydrolase n=1 Tax=Burkholderia multivorans TaxID=87883 RepID=UPI00018E3757|nr:alpha/beta hydrolase [Burkholderia multivorans]EEE00680.1 alpha/beta hydrolase fold protein [Burkholderia multivorans CGD1]MBU9309278.1 alpha/beta hydrolase [Burkholderia multivorans]MBU9570929.1 alpha/beta hydrolase [Burkholderia multivorans]MDN7948747.1 alpha/beta hydrolase [Burkholderia multivorans]MDN7963698.1 alpha/beta hydrolase [Burkholderia multivorans]